MSPGSTKESRVDALFYEARNVVWRLELDTPEEYFEVLRSHGDLP